MVQNAVGECRAVALRFNRVQQSLVGYLGADGVVEDVDVGHRHCDACHVVVLDDGVFEPAVVEEGGVVGREALAPRVLELVLELFDGGLDVLVGEETYGSEISAGFRAHGDCA